MQGLRVFHPRLFWKLFASYSLILVITALVLAVLVTGRLETSLSEQLLATLREKTHLALPTAERLFAERSAEEPIDLEGLAREAGVRITLVAPDGTVIGDSHFDVARMENHRSRPEIVDAESAPFGFNQRPSRTIGQEMLYVARRVRRGSVDHGTLRLAASLGAITDRIAGVRVAVGLGTGIGLGLALLLGFYVAREMTRPIARITRVARDLRSGKWDSRVFLARSDELGELAETLNDLAQDVRRRIETISREDAQLRAMLSGMVEGVIAVDQDDRITFCNVAARGLLGIAEPEPEGFWLWELAAIPELEELLRQSREAGTLKQRELALFTEVRERAIEAHAAPFAGGGQQGLVLVLNDVTELRRLERVRRDFVANVSHELKTPLTTIKGFVETLLDGALHDQAHNRRFLERITTNVDRLTHLVTDLLSLARIESEEHTVQRVAVDWRTILRDVLKRHEDGLQRKGLVLQIEGDASPVLVAGDPEAMTQVLDNLVDNAVKYTPSPGTVGIKLSESGARGTLEVSDSGVGIPREDLNRVFERFYRVDKARSREVGGTGLGLSIVKHLVLSMDGEVWVESEIGHGTSFFVSLPSAQTGRA